LASPQTENGYTKIANELLDALARIRLSGEETQVFMVILRKTYGFKKKSDKITLSQFTKLTGINRQNVYRAIKKLVDKNIVIKKDYSRLVSYEIQKDYSKWRPLSKKITVINIDSSCNQKRFGVSSKKITPSTKETNTKETNTKETYTKETISAEIDIQLSQLLIDLMLKNNPRSSIIKNLTEKQQKTWIDACRLMREKDERTPQEVEAIIRFSQSDEFWKSNILSMPKLREKFDQLWLKARKSKHSGIREWYEQQEKKYGKREGL